MIPGVMKPPDETKNNAGDTLDNIILEAETYANVPDSKR